LPAVSLLGSLGLRCVDAQGGRAVGRCTVLDQRLRSWRAHGGALCVRRWQLHRGAACRERRAGVSI